MKPKISKNMKGWELTYWTKTNSPDIIRFRFFVAWSFVDVLAELNWAYKHDLVVVKK